MMERNALTNATAQASQAESFAEQAHRVNPVVQPVGRVQIAQGSVSQDSPIQFWSINAVIFTGPSCPTCFSTTSSRIWRSMVRASRDVPTSASEPYLSDKIKRSAAQVLLSLNRVGFLSQRVRKPKQLISICRFQFKQLKQERDAALQRADVAGRNISQAHQRLEDKRKELFYLRKALFESIASTATKPPSYDKVTQATAAATSAPSPSPGPMATYAPPPGPPPAFRSRESLDKAEQNPPLFPEPQTLGAAGTSAIPSPGTNEGNGPTDPERNPQPSSPRPWGTRK